MRGRRRILTSVVWALVLGALVTLPLGGQRQISVEIWLTVVAVWLAMSITLHLLDQAPVLPGRLRGLWRWSPVDDHRTGRLPRGLHALEGTIVNARDNDRAYALRLRPRLIAVTGHHLGSRHGIDPVRNPEQAAEILGDLAWMVDPSVDDRTPTMAEIDSLLDRVIGPPDDRWHDPETDRPGGPTTTTAGSGSLSDQQERIEL